MINDPLEMNDLAEGEHKPKRLLKKLFKQFQKMKIQMDDPIDVSESFDNFMNNVAPSPIK
jgi:hypothetical protein